MSLIHRPSLLDHIPKMLRGHGNAHFSGQHPKHGYIARTCCKPSKGNDDKLDPHDAQKQNADEWKIAHGFSTVDRKTGRTVARDIPFEECFRR